MRAPQLVSEAADWFARMQEADVSAADRELFDAWLLTSPAHIAAYLQVSRVWGDLGSALDEMPDMETLASAARDEPHVENVVALSRVDALSAGRPAHQFRPAGPGTSRSGVVRAAVAALAAAVLTSAVWLLVDHRMAPIYLETGVGEQRSISLADGSIMHLNTGSQARVRLNDSERRIVLSRGEARFTVARDSRRPFVVVTPQATVRAIGTVFNVQAAAGNTAVTVLEGRVALSAVTPGAAGAAAYLELDAGQQATLTGQGELYADTGPSLEQARAWPQRQLVFRDDTLAEVVAEFNRYHTASIRIDDPLLAGLKINGVFDARDSASLIEYLQRYRDVHVQDLPGGGKVISRPRR